MHWPRLRIGTRSSRLARVQVNMVCTDLYQQVPALQDRIEIVYLDTPGDRDRTSCLEDLGGRGVFTDSLDAYVASGEVDCVVHAMKDMEPALRSNLVVGATLKREDPREVLIAPRYDSLDVIPTGGVFGSSSIRRRALLKRLRPDLQFTLLRGNVEERIAQMDGTKLDGTILAYAGLARLGLLAHVQEVFPLGRLPPDPAQGAIGVICHRDSFIVRRLLQMINHHPTFAEITAERALLRSLPKPDALAIGANAVACQDRLVMSALLVSEDGAQEWSHQLDGHTDDAEPLGQRIGAALRGPAQSLLSA